MFLGLHSTLCIPEAISVCMFVCLSVCPHPTPLLTGYHDMSELLCSILPSDPGRLKPQTKILRNRD